MRSAAFILALLVVVAGLPPAAGAAQSVEQQSPPGAVSTDTLPSLDAPEQTRIVVEFRENRSARWSITMRYRLDTKNETEAFRRYVTAFERRDVDAGLDVQMFRTIVNRSSEATGRSMAVVAPEYRGTVGNQTGTVTLSFTWTNFLTRTDENTLRFNDAVLLPDNQTWLSSLQPGQTMVIRAPDGYSVTDSPFGVENNSVVISGPREFDGNTDITYQRDSIQSPPWGLVAGGLVVAAVVLAGALLVRRRRFPSTTDGGELSADVVDVSEPDATPPANPIPPDDSSEPADDEADDIDLELLSDEERVERLLERNDGRMKQATIVRETGWSDAKVSQLLSSMADEGRVDKLRLGRENLISLPQSDDE